MAAVKGRSAFPRAAGSPEQELRRPRRGAAPPHRRRPAPRAAGSPEQELRLDRELPALGALPGSPSRRFTRTGIETGASRRESAPPFARGPRAAGSPEQELRPDAGKVPAHRATPPSRRFTRTGIETAWSAPRCRSWPRTPSRRFTRTGIETSGCSESSLRRWRRRPEPQVHQNRN